MNQRDLPEWQRAERGPDWNPVTGNRPLDADVQPMFTGLLAIIAELNRPRIVLARVVQTCWVCPSQWDAWDGDGRYYYLRYRWGVGTVDSPHGTQIMSFKHGDDLDGSISLEDFMAAAGLTLVPEAEAR